jgi:hypothetical protein
MVKLATGAAERRAGSEELRRHGLTQLRNSNDTNNGDEANQKSVLDQRRAFLILADGVDQLKSLRHYSLQTRPLGSPGIEGGQTSLTSEISYELPSPEALQPCSHHFTEIEPSQYTVR